MKDMKSVNTVRTSTVMVSRWVRQWSRITLTYPLLTMLFMLVLGGWNSEAWGGTAKLTLRAVANSSKGGYVMVSDDSNATFSGTATDQSKDKKGDTGWHGLSSKKLTLYAYASAKDGCVFLGWAESETGSIVSKDTKISYTTGNLYYSDTESKTYYAIFARMVANTPAEGSTLTFGNTTVTDASAWQTITINHAHAGTVTIEQSGNDGDFFIGATEDATSEIESFTSTSETTKTLHIQFRPTSNHLRTCTLTVSSNNGLSSLTYYLQGTGYAKPSVKWVNEDGVEISSGEVTLGKGEIIKATCETEQTISYSNYNTTYFEPVTYDGGPALRVKNNFTGTFENLSVRANLAANNDSYIAAYSEDFVLNVTSLTPQRIVWEDDITDLDNSQAFVYYIPLTAVAYDAETNTPSGMTISYSVDKTDYVDIYNGQLRVKAIGGPTTITATAASSSSYAPISVSKQITVSDVKTACATKETDSGGSFNKNGSHTVYVSTPGKMTFYARRENILLRKDLTVTEYNNNGGVLHTTTISYGDIGTSDPGSKKEITLQPTTASVKFSTSANYTYYITSIEVERITSVSKDKSEMAYNVYKGMESSAQLGITYSNVPVYLTLKHGASSKWSMDKSKVGGCGKRGSAAITLTFSAAETGTYTDTLYIKSNTGVDYGFVKLTATVTAVAQFLDTWNIKDTYNTTDQTTLSAKTTENKTNFTFSVQSSTPANIVNIDANGQMTFNGSGTAVIKAVCPAYGIYDEFSDTHDITINKVTPTIAKEPNVAEIKYKDNLVNGVGCQLSGGKATVTLRGVANTEIVGTFTWTNTGQVTDGQGSHDYSITFTPTDGGMYNSKTFTQSVTISRADGGIEMNNGEVKVKVAGINDDLAECSLDLNSLIQSKIVDAGHAGNVTYEVTSENKGNASIVNGVFSATAVGTYTIVATQAQTDYYEEATDEFTVTVNKLEPTIVFDNTDDPQVVYSGDSIGEPAVRMYNGKVIDRKIQYVSNDIAIYVGATADLNKYPYLKARDVVAEEGSAVNVTITASAKEDALYSAATESVEHNYAVRAKRSPEFTMDTYVNVNASKTLKIGETATITYNENTDANLTVGTASASEYITYVHDAEHRTITVTAQKGALTGDGEQSLTVNQPGTDRLFPRTVVYTFTVERNVSGLSLAPLVTSMGVEDTVTTIYTGLTNTAAGLEFSCSPEGSMKYEDGKLIALAAGTNTVTFSQPATESWTGVSQSKTITVSRKDPEVATELANRHAWYSIIEHPFKSLNTEKELQITSSNESMAKYIKEEDKIYVYGTSGNVTFTVNQEANYKYNAVVNYQMTFEIFQPNNRLPFTLTNGNLSDYNGGSKGGVSWNSNGVVVGSANALSKVTDWSAKYIILKFVGVPDKLSFDFENTVSIATQYGWHFYESSNGSDWNLIKEYQDLLMNATGGTSSGSESNLQLDPATQYIKLEYHGNYGGRFKNVHVTERKEIAPRDATKDFGLGYNGNDPTMRAITVDWYNVKPCTVTITGADADKFVLDEGSKTINSQLDHYGTVDLKVSYKHETNSETTHTATLHIVDVDGNYADVTLTGQTTPAPQTIIWRNDLTPMPIEGSFQNAAMVATGQKVTLESDHPEIVRVVDNTTLEPVSAGTARVTATAAGSTKWAETTAYMDIEVTTLKVQYITWTDNLSNRKREEGQTVNITLTATSSAGLPITYELDEDAQTFASINGNVLSLTDWGSGQVIAKQVGNEEYVAVQASKSLVSRNPNAKCRPLVGEYKDEYTLHTLAVKEIPIYGEPDSVTFWAKCDWSALWGMWVAEEYNGSYHDIQEISRTGNPNITSDYQHYSFPLHRNATAVKLYTKTGATMTRTFKNVEIPLAKYLELAENTMNFSQVDKGSTKTQSFYINYSNLSGVLEVEMENKENTQFTVVTTTVGGDCGDIAQNVRIEISCTGSALGTENNKIIISNKDQRLEIPVSATVVLPSQTITWEPKVNVLTTDHVVLSATATSELPVSFTSGNTDIAEIVYKGGVYSLDIKSYGDVAITAHQPGDNENWSAATDKTLTFHISRVVPSIITNPTATGVVLPNTLAGSILEGGSVDGGIAGTFRWQDATISVTKGTATYTAVFDPENDDWYETVPVEVAVPILKTPQTISWAREDVSEEGCSDVVILDATASSGLPITYHSSDSTKAYVVDAVVNDEPVKKLYILKGGDVIITAVQPGDETYAAAPSVQKTITLIRVLPTIETLPTATDMFVHHFLSNSTLLDGVVKAGENTVTGVFNWENEKELMDEPGINQRTVIFQPYNSDYYQPVSVEIGVYVRRFAPVVNHNFTTATKVYGTALSEFVRSGSGTAYDYTDPAYPTIEGTFTWKDETYIPSVSETTALLVFHPDHSEWYDDVEVEVPIEITPATIVSATAEATIFYGQVLSEAVLVNTTQGIVNGTMGVVAGTVTWDPSLDLMEYYIEGTHSNLPIRFSPTDPNYESIEIAGTAVLTVEAGYVFDGNNGASTAWSENDNWQGHEAPVDNERVVILADVDVTTDVEVESMTIKEGVTVVVKDGATLTIGSSDSYVRNEYGNLVVEQGGQVQMGAGTMHVNDFTLKAKLGDATNVGKSGQVRNPNSLQVNGNAYFDLALDPTRECTYGWYDFTVPFPVNAATGITRYSKSTGEEVAITCEVHYAIMDFSESRRVETGYGWKKFHGVMQPGQCYSITTNNEDYIYRFKMANGGTFNNTLSETLAYTETDSEVRGWNGLGNGTMAYADLSAAGIEHVQLYNHATNSYTPVNMSDYTYVVGSAFFVQAPAANHAITYSQNGASHTLRAPQRNREVEEFTLTLSQEDANIIDDRLFVGVSEDALEGYEIGRDLTKFGTPTEAKVAQVWVNAYDLKLCDIDMPLKGNNANCELGLFAPEAGQYILSVDEAPSDASLFLTFNGRIIWNLSVSPYLFDLSKGSTAGYGLKLHVNEVATDIEQTDDSQEAGVRKVLIDDQIYIITSDGAMYDLMGKSIKY